MQIKARCGKKEKNMKNSTKVILLIQTRIKKFCKYISKGCKQFLCSPKYYKTFFESDIYLQGTQGDGTKEDAG